MKRGVSMCVPAKPADLVRGKRVALVGRAASIHQHGDGKRIDACDVVIRVNWILPLQGDPLREGSRTDIVLHAYTAVLIPENARAHGALPWRKSDKLGSALAKQYGFEGVTPRTGVTAIAMLAAARARSVYLTGYDLYETGHATKNLYDPSLRKRCGTFGNHDTRADAVILAALIKRHGCEVDGVLARALRAMKSS